MRKCWLPKRPELPEQCVSCPFREGNDEELAKVLDKLRARFKVMGPVTPDKIAFAREEVRRDLKFSGDFICHLTAYDASAGMTPKDPSEHRQCPGASKVWRGAAT